MEQEVQLVVFKLQQADGVIEYAIPITKVQEIIQVNAPTRLPQTPDFVEGIMSLRGKIIPIINLKKRFNLGSSALENETTSAVVDVNGNTVGIMVDEVSEVLRLSSDHIEAPPAVIKNISAEYLVGIGKLHDRLLLMLDVDKIFNAEERAELASLAKQNI